MKFALVLTVWLGSEADTQSYWVDHSLNGEDCLEYVTDESLHPLFDDIVSTANGKHWWLSCTPDK